MADSINVTTQALTETAHKIQTINGILDDRLKEINKTMNNLEATWKSDAANDIRSAMNALTPRFEQYKNVVDSYARFLEDTAQAYETTESAIQNNAGQFVS